MIEEENQEEELKQEDLARRTTREHTQTISHNHILVSLVSSRQLVIYVKHSTVLQSDVMGNRNRTGKTHDRYA